MIGPREQPGDIYQGLLFRGPSGNHEELVFSPNSTLPVEPSEIIKRQMDAKDTLASVLRGVRALKYLLAKNIQGVKEVEDFPGSDHQKITDLCEDHIGDMTRHLKYVRDASLNAGGLRVALSGIIEPVVVQYCDYDAQNDALRGQPGSVLFQPEEIVIE